MKKTAKRKSARSLVLQRFASDTRQTALVPATKKKPRGRPFEKGNKIGNRFKKGEPSANPNGRPPSREIARSYRDWIAGNVTIEELKRHGLPRELFGHSRAEVIAWVRGEAALRGDLSSGIELADRAEGKPATTLNVSGGDDPMGELLRGFQEVRVALYGEIKKEDEDDKTRSEGEIESES